MNHKGRKILYVDDDPDDREMFELALSSSADAGDLVFATNGLEAINYLKATVERDSDLPCIVVLDINMPYLDGRETYHQMLEDDTLRSLDVAILTSSKNPEDQNYFERFGVEYFVKPVDFSLLKKIAHHLVEVCNSKD